MPNTQWQIAFGPYALTVDRSTLRFDLRDTKAGIVWGENLPLGWIEVEDRETFVVSRHDFGDCKMVTVSEKAGAQGKRILFGLDAPGGVPVDVYVICTEREIQLTVEASRDTKTHRVVGFGLVPGLVSVPDDGASYLVLPSGEGSGILARDVPDGQMLQKKQIPFKSFDFPIWQAYGVSMPFMGAVRAKPGAKSVADPPAGSIALVTDSAYGTFRVKRYKGGGAKIDTEYERDPERRRLDVRLVVLPGENHVAIARAYRDKIIGDKNHVTLRRKIRERPVIDKLIGAAWYADVQIDGETPFKPDARDVWGNDYAPFVQVVALRPEDNFAPLVPQLPGEVIALRLQPELLQETGSRWDEIEKGLQKISDVQTNQAVAVTMGRIGDWSVVALDFWQMPLVWTRRTFGLPLPAVVYHDSVVMPRPVQGYVHTPFTTSHGPCFLATLLRAASGFYEGLASSKPPIDDREKSQKIDRRVRMHAVLSPLHRLTFSAFLTAHRFLTPDALVEEAEYSDKTCIVINRSETDDYENPDLHLPPGGFFVRHTQMEAHDALRIGDRVFDTRAWRIRRALDNKPLAESADVETREFPI